MGLGFYGAERTGIWGSGDGGAEFGIDETQSGFGSGDGGVESGLTRLSWDLGFSELSLWGTVYLGRVVSTLF